MRWWTRDMPVPVINKMVFNLWGWEATLPESVSDNDWNQIYDTYVMDKYRLDIKERFKKSGNLYAYQSILARLLETVRKGYWKADKKRVDQMLLQFNETIREAGLACNLNICNNEKLMQFISDRINDMPSLTTEEKSRYKSALDDLRHKAKTEDADADSTTDGGNDKIYELQIQDDKWLFKQK